MRILRASREVEYVICGAGDDAAAISTLAERAGLEVRFTGQLDQAPWLGALNAADVVLHPTPGELFPNIVAEAMLVGRALVAVDSGATPELVGRGGDAGILVAEGDARGLATAVQALLEDRERRARMGVAARERISRQFPIDKMEKGYVRLIESLAR